MVVNMLHYSGYISSYTFVRKRGEVAIRALYFIFSSFCQLSMSSGNTSSTIVSSDTQAGSISWIEFTQFIKRWPFTSSGRLFFLSGGGGAKKRFYNRPYYRNSLVTKKKSSRVMTRKESKIDRHTFGWARFTSNGQYSGQKKVIDSHGG